MRDGTIYAMQEANARRVALLFSQFEFLMTRQDLEKFKQAVDALQGELIQKSRQKMQEVAAKPKITVVSGGGTIISEVKK
jgi:hypothetical protein